MDIDSDVESENWSPSPVVAKKKPAAKAKPLGTSNLAPQQPQGHHAGKAIEDIYQKKTQLEHILLRPDTYIGSTEKQQQPLWVHDGERMTFKPITYAPGLFKIFDEILVNAADNKVRDPTMDTVRVDIDQAANTIRVYNNGLGIPVEVHKEEGVYVPELIFGHLLTSSNYNDKDAKVTGGRNGYGAKLANIFSTHFCVETADGTRLRRFKQTFTDNMGKKSDPEVKPCKASDNWTAITFKPDLAKFDMEELEDDVVALMRKRVYDVAGVLGKTVKVYLNGVRLPVKSFQDYCELYLGPKDAAGVPRVYERVNDRWEICVCATDGQFQQVSFVNSICTSKGGTHVDYLVNQISKYMVEKLNKKSKNANVKPFMVKNHLWVFCNSQIVNPAFDSQTKETLTTKASSFGSKCELTPALLEKISKSGLMENIMSYAAFKSQKELKKSDGAKRSRLIGITKLSDANDAGTRGSQDCTLILTEGDSAKSLAMSGLSVVGHDKWGVFPLRGKLLNVRDATASQIGDNVEIQHIKQILGLQHGKQYEDSKALRYGSLMIMTDQDHDGSHIKGLIMNFLHTFYPSLLKIPGFLVEFITPIVKAKKGKQVLAFYTMPEYENWRESLPSLAGWDIKYYKGLGTSSSSEAKEYFARLDSHRKFFAWEGEEDGQAIEMAFSKKRVEDRKKWLGGFVPGTYLDQSVDTITYSDFVHKELILFSRADLERSIPCLVDGLKPGQRKILYCAFKRNLKKDIKVAQLSGYVSEHSAYHHGEASLQQTIIGLAQDFVGSNNINLLFPSGQFGTRLQGGKDAASARYVYTRLGPLTRHLFNAADDKLLDYLNEEGQSIEPQWYMPILPTVLVNGAEGIGTGWSTYVPNYNPKDIAENLKRLLHGEAIEPMMPWYRGFRGGVQEVPSKTGGKSYNISGIVSQSGDHSLDITELPVRKWTQDYKEFLEALLKGDGSKAAKDDDKKGAKSSAGGGEVLLADYKEHHTDTTVHFSLDVVPSKMEVLVSAGLENKLKLTSKISTGNMMLFDADGKIKRYESPEEILTDFFGLRLQYYERRRVALLQDAEWEHMRASNKIRFIQAVIKGTLVISNRKKADVEADLEAQGFDRMAKKGQAGADQEPEAAEGEEVDAAAAKAEKGRASYDYLLSMQLWSLTAEKVATLQEEADAAAGEVSRLRDADIRQMYMDDLDAFLEAYDEWEADMEVAAARLAKQQKNARKGAAGKGKAAAGKKGGKKANPWSDDDGGDSMDEDDDEDGEFVVAAKPRKPAAPHAPRAPAAPKAPVLPKPAPAAPANRPAYAVPSAAPPKAGSKGSKAAAAAAPAPAPAAGSNEEDQEISEAPAESLSLAERLKKMALCKGTSAGTAAGTAAAAAAAAAKKPTGRAAAAKKKAYEEESEDDDDDDQDDLISIEESEDDSDEFDPDEAMSPALGAKKKAAGGGGRGKVAAAGAGAAPKAPRQTAKSRAAAAAVAAAAAGSPSPGKAAFGRTLPAAGGSEGAAGAKKAAPKRKPRGKAVVIDSDDDEPSASQGGAPANSDGSFGGFETGAGAAAAPAAAPGAGVGGSVWDYAEYDATTPSPALARKKVPRVATSPLAAPAAFPAGAAAKRGGAAAGGAGKAAGGGKAGAAKKAAAAPKRRVVQDSDDDDVVLIDDSPMGKGAAAAPTAAAAAARPARARRAPMKSYVESSGGEEDSGGDDDDYDGNSDFGSD